MRIFRFIKFAQKKGKIKFPIFYNSQGASAFTGKSLKFREDKGNRKQYFMQKLNLIKPLLSLIFLVLQIDLHAVSHDDPRRRPPSDPRNQKMEKVKKISLDDRSLPGRNSSVDEWIKSQHKGGNFQNWRLIFSIGYSIHQFKKIYFLG